LLFAETNPAETCDNFTQIRLGDPSVRFDCSTISPGAVIAKIPANTQTPEIQTSPLVSRGWEDYYLILARNVIKPIEVKSRIEQYDVGMNIVLNYIRDAEISMFIFHFDISQEFPHVTLTDFNIDVTTSIAPKVKSKSEDIADFLGKLKTLYRVYIDQETIVGKYLKKHSDLVSVIEIAVINAKQFFDEKTELSLEMYYDIDSEEQNLTLYVRQSLYEDEVMKKIDMICDAYESELMDKSDWFLVTTDFQHPKHR